MNAAFVRGVLLGGFLKKRSTAELLQRATDGAIARYDKPREWEDLCGDYFDIQEAAVCGAESELILIQAKMP